jgi:hypothetical protein
MSRGVLLRRNDLGFAATGTCLSKFARFQSFPHPPVAELHWNRLLSVGTE